MQTLSVVLANYNHARFLPRALNAIVSQSRPPDELILVDDASTDDSVSIMRAFAARHPFISVVQNEQNLGATGAGARGLEIARGDYVQCAAADDYMLPGFIERTMREADQRRCGIVSTALLVLTEGVETIDDGAPQHGNPAAHAFRDDAPPGYMVATTVSPFASLAPSTVYRADLVRQLGGLDATMGMHNITFLLRGCALAAGMSYIDDPLYTWVYRAAGLTAREQADAAHIEAICRRHEQRMAEVGFPVAFRKRWRAETWTKLDELRGRPPFIKRILRRFT
jgi:glycosyltransferase involved in cell wall biosynthesis